MHTLYTNILSLSFDVIILSETWLTPNIIDKEFIDDRYLVFRDDRDRIATNKREGGGVLIAVLRVLRPVRILACPSPTGIEHVIIQVPASRSNTYHVISAAYIPPRTLDDVYLSHLSALENILTAPCTESFYIAGDYNLPEIEWSGCTSHASTQPQNNVGRSLLYLMAVTNASQYNTIKNKLGRVLDLFISNAECLIQSDISLLQPDSHHPPFSVLTSLETPFTPMKRHSTIKYNFFKANYQEINVELNKLNWDELFFNLSSEQAVDAFYDYIYGIVRLHVPLSRQKSSTFPVWFNASLIKIFKNKECAWIRWKKLRNLYDYEKFSILRKRFKLLCEQCYNKYMQTVEDSIPINVKHFWTYISNRKKGSGLPANMQYKNNSSNCPAEICSLFSTFFNSVYEPSTFDPNTWTPPETLHENSVCIPDIYLEKSVILKALTSLDLNKGAGPDGLPPSFLKNTAQTICVPLHILFNKCLREGIFPCVWKRAFITPIHKSGDKGNVENYRPISILSTLSKLFEGLVHSHLFPQLNHLIIPEQHGFVKSKSTTTNLMIFTQFLFENMDTRTQVDAVYTDFQKAFDKVDHKLLLDKIAFNGIRGNLLRWFVSYIFHRTQKVVINGFESGYAVVESGVPQGSILGPLLFILFINDIKSCIVNSEFLMYADDIKIYKACVDSQDCLLLQEDLCRLSQYCLVNKLHLSLPKCHFISFTKNKNTLNFPYTLNGIQLKNTECTRDLGVLLDCKLHLDTHIDHIINKAFQMYGFVMRSCKDFKKPTTFLFLYKTLVRSQLEYAVPIWCPHYDKYKQALEMVQKKFLRATHYKCFRTRIPYADLLKHFEVLSLDSRRSLIMVVMLHGICNNKFNCTELSNRLCYVVPRTVTRREVRAPRLFYTARCRTKAGVRAPLRRLFETYNTHFNDFDIFALSQSKFKSMVSKFLASRP